MAVNLDTQNIIEYPGVIKRVTVDQTKIIPTNQEGDELFVATVATNAYSDNTLNTAIQDLYIMDLKVGWAKSSGLAGTAGKFDLDATHNTMQIKMDATVSGSDGSGYYPITLAYNASTPKSGEDIAADMEIKIRAVSCVVADAGYQLSYSNCSVEFKESKFWIMSGSFSDSYTDTYRTSVAVISGTSNDCISVLGFTDPVTSEELANISVAEALVTSNYTNDTSPLSIGAGTGIVAGDSLSITDGTNIDYFTAITVSGTDITVAVSGTNGYRGITNDYATADDTRVQVLKNQDPDAAPQSHITSIDGAIRYGLKSIINQIDYSS